jgi:rubrerythrin
MSNSKDKIAEVLKTAIRAEEDGFRFYDLVSKRADNEDAKRKLENLRDDEIRHKRTLLDIYDKYVGGKIGELPEEGLSVLSEVFRKGQVNSLKSEMQFINLAIEAELAASKYYQEQRVLVDDEEFREIFDKLAEEEHSHYELLMAEREALAGNYHWFGYDDSSPMEH